MITLNNVCKNYTAEGGAVTALQDINLHVERGEIYGIIGKSGAGKSTLIRCVNLLERPSSGNVIVDSESLTTLSESELRSARRNIGMIFQHFNLLATRSVYDNIALPLELAGHTRKEIADTIAPLLELTGLTTKKNHYPSQLSGGQKQRVAIARALANKPKVLLSDEATSALDPETTQNILELLINIRNKLGVTILLITHQMSVIKACCDRVAILDHGKLIEENDVGTFFANPQTTIASNFIASSSPQKLPAAIVKHLVGFEQPNSHPVLRFRFFGDAATKPIIAHLINQYHWRINILQANVEHIKENVMGLLILAIYGDKSQIEAGMLYLQKIGVSVEVMGYVPNDIITFA